MRLVGHDVATDHALLADVGAGDHHAQAAGQRFAINGQSIGPGSYSLRVALGHTGCQVLRAIMRGPITVGVQGHTGVFVVGTATAAQSCAIGIRPYPGGLQAYMGGYSRLHGDSFLSYADFGQGTIRLQDAYIDGSDAVMVFHNAASVTRTLTVYGLVAAK